MGELIGFLFKFLIIGLLIAIAIYVAVGIFLNKFNKLVYGKGTAMAWIPVLDVYLLGKLTFNKLVGWILIACLFLTGTYTTEINGVETVYSILPEGISSTISSIYGIAVFGLFIYAIVKYNKLKKANNNLYNEAVTASAVQPAMTNTIVKPATAEPMVQPATAEPMVQPTDNNIQ